MICCRGDEPVFGAEGRPAICPLFDLSKLIDYKDSNALKKMISRSRKLATGTSAAARTWLFPAGFIIHVQLGVRRNSSTNKL